MNKNIKTTVIVCLLLVVLVFILTYFRITRNNVDAELSPQELRDTGALVYDEPVMLSAFNLMDHDGESYDNNSLTGKWSLLFFGFTSCPDICPLTLNELGRFYRSEDASPWRADTEIVMVSVDPFRDTPEKLRDYMTPFHADFRGITGEYEDIAGFARQLFVAHSEPPSDEERQGDNTDYMIDHSGNIMIINPEGKYHGFMEASIRADNIGIAYSSIRASYAR